MKAQLDYLKATIEGEPEIERWEDWFKSNRAALEQGLGRTEFLRLKLYRYHAIGAILDRFGLSYTVSDRYEYLGTKFCGGVPGRCHECGATVISHRWSAQCPNGCWAFHATPARSADPVKPSGP